MKEVMRVQRRVWTGKTEAPAKYHLEKQAFSECFSVSDLWPTYSCLRSVVWTASALSNGGAIDYLGENFWLSPHSVKPGLLTMKLATPSTLSLGCCYSLGIILTH